MTKSFKPVGNRFLNRGSALLLLCASLSSCAPPAFLPVASPAPMLRQKGEFAVSGGVSRSQYNFLGGSGSAAYSPEKNVLVFGSYNYFGQSSGDSLDGYSLKYHYGEIGAGAYLPVGKRGVLEFLTGYGRSRLHWDNPNTTSDNTRSKEWGYNTSGRFFCQFNAGLKDFEIFDIKAGITFGFRAAALRFHHWDYQEWHSERGGSNLFSSPARRETTPRPDNYFAQYEPSLTLNVSLSDNIKLFQQNVFSYSTLYPTPGILFENGCSSIGISFYFKTRKEEKPARKTKVIQEEDEDE